MNNLPRTPTASHPRASPDGRFPMYADEEMVSPPMCGQTLLTKLLRKSPGRQTAAPKSHIGDSSNESKSCMNPAKQLNLLRNNRYEEVTGSLHSPDTRSCSSSDKSKEDTTPLVHNDPGTAVLPYIVQFDPKDLQQVMGNQQEDTTTLYKAKQRSTGHSLRQPSWSTSLPVVAEEKSTDSDDLRDEELRRSKSKSASSYHDSSNPSDDPTSQSALINLPPQEKNDMLIGMRHLVLKQQMKLAELSEQNSQYRREIRSYQHTLLSMKEDQMIQKDQIGLLTIEKETFEAEAIWLREKMKAFEAEAMKAPQSSPESPVYEDSLASQFQRLMTDQPDRQTDGRKEDDEEFNFQEFTKHLMSDNIIGNILGSDKYSSNRTVDQMAPARDERTSPRARGSSRSAPAREEREDIHSTESHTSFETRSSAYTDSSKEEVALFKSRLDTIQQRRIQRQKGRNVTSTRTTRSVVRFDDTAKAKAPAAGRE